MEILFDAMIDVHYGFVHLYGGDDRRTSSRAGAVSPTAFAVQPKPVP